MELWGTSDVERRGAAIMLILLVYVGSALALHYLFLLNRWLGIRPLRCACFLLFSRDYTY